MYQIKEINEKFNYVILFVIITGIVSRILVSTYGFNVDMEYWRLFADVIKFNGPIYEVGMNYGPVWAYLLYFLDQIPFFIEGEIESLRFKVTIFLTLIDLLIFITIIKIHSLKIGTLFFLNPISIFITGFHSQFDNLAVFLGLLAILVYEKNKKKIGFYFCSFILSISLITKHILLIFPIWLAVKEKKFYRKILIISIPIILFFICFIPFVDNYSLIYDHVLNYKSSENGIFWRIFTPQFFGTYLGYNFLFLLTLFVLSLFFDAESRIRTYYLYLISIVLFSPSIANQYLAIPVVAIAYFWNRFFFLYTLACCLFFLVDFTAFNIEYIKDIVGWTRNTTRIGYKIIIIFLALGFVQTIVSKEKFDLFFKNIIVYFYNKIKNQFLLK